MHISLQFDYSREHNYKEYVPYCHFSVPSAPPTSVNVTRVTGATITVKWEAVNCIHQNGEITGYLVKYRAEPNGEVLVVNGSEKQITLSNLMPFTNYSIEVAAVNSAGTGKFSSASMTVTRLSEYIIACVIFLGLRLPNISTATFSDSVFGQRVGRLYVEMALARPS